MYGVVPPLAASVAPAYAVPTVPLGSGLLAIVKVVARMLTVRPVVEAVWCVGSVESVAVMVTATAPAVAAVGVPLIAPLLLLIVRPAGRPVAV